MMIRMCGTVSLLLVVLIQSAGAWHLLGNTQFHCWPLAATASSPTPWSSCTGISMRWVKAPPQSIREREAFNVTYELVVDNSTFWSWAVSVNSGSSPVKNNIFASTGAGASATNASAMSWCLNTACPASATSATITNCCVHHVNVHSCPGGSSLCGPWIPASGNIYTHSAVMIGPLLQGNWTSTISGLYQQGNNEIIAHFKLADMHLALYDQITVVPRAQCGNNKCETDENESCENCVADCGRCPLEPWMYALIGVAGVIVLAVLLIVFLYFRHKSNKKFWDESWIINWADVNENVGAVGFLGSALSFSSKSSSASNNALQQNAAKRQIFTKIGDYKGKTLAIKPVKKKAFLLTKHIRKEVHDVRCMDHQNLVRFVGASIEVPNVAIFTEYCPKGSLSDILLNEDVPISWSFRFAFSTDIARGMAYLHQHRMFHGRLKSQNCIVDDRWTVKISDYGLTAFRVNERLETDSCIEEDDYSPKASRVYNAPELLDVAWQEATEKGDVYAFGVILIEIATRNDPFGEMGIDMISEDWKPALPEDFALGDGSEDSRCPNPVGYKNVVDQCMSVQADFRPTFNRVKAQIHSINPSKLSAVDLMMNMMEKYSKHLESIVTERTQELVQEKQKTDRLLYAMLPKAVAEQLKHGQNVTAESFEVCTIYFSDIVGFTNISGGSTPMEVVALLNKLYTCFDSVIDKYDVYKVETIGDAYMVVSGVPNRNGHNHVHQVACMSIDLVKESEQFVIPHRPGEPLKIRVGLHSGPCVSGVVGLKMPRYCLFGDTVNTASRMESNGEAYKIHCSSSTADLLMTKHKGFRLSKRGTIPIKGKGDMTTWWLDGREVEIKNGSVAPSTLLASSAAQRKISTISNGNDSGFNEREAIESPEDKLPGTADKDYCQIQELPDISRPPARLPPLNRQL